jgi:acyl-CoA thioester hydrolase
MSADPSSEHFELPRTVADDDIDVMEHVNNIAYLRWVQDAAVAHWTASATDEERASVAWVVVRHEIDYLTSAVRGDEVIARTWVGSTVKHYFERHTEILRAKDRKLLARARTLWCPIDLRSGRPMRASENLLRRFSVPSGLSNPS